MNAVWYMLFCADDYSEC